jgi:acyl carrier protein
MQEKEIELFILAALRELQTNSGRLWVDLTQDSRPLRDLDGFDSLSAVEVTAAIEQKLGCHFESESIFVASDGKRVLTVKQITEVVAKATASKGNAT